MKARCPNPKCQSSELKKVLNYNNGSDNIDGIGHYNLECVECGRQFNLWDCPIEQIKKVFGDSWEIYA